MSTLRRTWPAPIRLAPNQGALGWAALGWAALGRAALAWAVLIGLAAGCTVESQPLDPLPFGECVCEEGVCPTSVCDLRIEVDPKTCDSEVGQVEVLVGSQLEPHVWRPGDAQRTCSTIQRGATKALFARADTAWQWKEEILCPAPDGSAESAGPTIVRVLHCSTDP